MHVICSLYSVFILNIGNELQWLLNKSNMTEKLSTLMQTFTQPWWWWWQQGMVVMELLLLVVVVVAAGSGSDGIVGGGGSREW